MGRISPYFLTMLAAPPAPAEEPVVEQVEEPVPTPTPANKCAVRACSSKPTHQVLVVAHPGEETFTFENLQTCVRHIPDTPDEVFPNGQLDTFREIYPHTKHFSIRALALG